MTQNNNDEAKVNIGKVRVPSAFTAYFASGLGVVIHQRFRDGDQAFLVLQGKALPFLIRKLQEAQAELASGGAVTDGDDESE